MWGLLESSQRLPTISSLACTIIEEQTPKWKESESSGKGKTFQDLITYDSQLSSLLSSLSPPPLDLPKSSHTTYPLIRCFLHKSLNLSPLLHLHGTTKVQAFISSQYEWCNTTFLTSFQGPIHPGHQGQSNPSKSHFLLILMLQEALLVTPHCQTNPNSLGCGSVSSII